MRTLPTVVLLYLGLTALAGFSRIAVADEIPTSAPASAECVRALISPNEMIDTMLGKLRQNPGDRSSHSQRLLSEAKGSIAPRGRFYLPKTSAAVGWDALFSMSLIALEDENAELARSLQAEFERGLGPVWKLVMRPNIMTRALIEVKAALSLAGQTTANADRALLLVRSLSQSKRRASQDRLTELSTLLSEVLAQLPGLMNRDNAAIDVRIDQLDSEMAKVEACKRFQEMFKGQPCEGVFFDTLYKFEMDAIQTIRADSLRFSEGRAVYRSNAFSQLSAMTLEMFARGYRSAE